MSAIHGIVWRHIECSPNHWQRYRVGPRDALQIYQRRLIDPIVVNAGEHRFDEPLTVYRLPLPPTP